MTPLDYCRQDATFTHEVSRRLATLPPPTWWWLLMHLNRWYMDSAGTVVVTK